MMGLPIIVTKNCVGDCYSCRHLLHLLNVDHFEEEEEEKGRDQSKQTRSRRKVGSDRSCMYGIHINVDQCTILSFAYEQDVTV